MPPDDASTPPRLAPTILVALALIVAVAYLRRDEALVPERFFLEKFEQASALDLVVVGNSRVNEAVAPGVMRSALPGWRVFNFAFDAQRFSGDYLDHAASLLDPASEHPALALGVSPTALFAPDDTHYERLQRRSAGDRLVARHLGAILNGFRPLRVTAETTTLEEGHSVRLHSDGWRAAHRTNPDETRALATYQKLLTPDGKHRFDPQAVTRLAARVRVWRNKGIRVFAFRPPSTQAMAALEDRIPGYDAGAVRGLLEAAGATWLEFPAGAYPTHDGSHLQEEGARQFSRDLAEAIRSRL